jgi:hypothetical protein
LTGSRRVEVDRVHRVAIDEQLFRRRRIPPRSLLTIFETTAGGGYAGDRRDAGTRADRRFNLLVPQFEAVAADSGTTVLRAAPNPLRSVGSGGNGLFSDRTLRLL